MVILSMEHRNFISLGLIELFPLNKCYGWLIFQNFVGFGSRISRQAPQILFLCTEWIGVDKIKLYICSDATY